LASQQQRAYGEVLMIRPFSLMFLFWLAIVLAGAVLGLLFLGHQTESVHPSTHQAQTSAPKDSGTR